MTLTIRVSRLLYIQVIAVLLAACADPAAVPSTNAAGPEAQRWDGGLWVVIDSPATQLSRSDVGTLRGDTLPLTPAWRQKSDALNAIRTAGGALPANDSRCIPSGMPFMMMANAIEFLYSPGRIGIVAGSRGIQIRNILVDGRAHTTDELLFDSFGGESIGIWEGDTLVVDTIGIRPSNEIIYALPGGRMHVVERMRLIAPDRLQVDTTIESAEALQTPWTYRLVYQRSADRYTTESGYCVAAFDRVVDPRTGEQGFDLTPPAEEGIGVPQSRRQ